MNRETYEQAKKVLGKIHNELKDPTLTPEQRRGLELHAAKLAGVLAHPCSRFHGAADY